MQTQNDNSVDVAEIRSLINDWGDAVRAKDIDRLMSHYATEVVVFDLVPPLQCKGAAAYRKNWENWLGSFEGPADCEMRELSITAGDDVAFSHALTRISGTMKNGQNTNSFVRATVCFRKLDDKWLVTHEHVSLPFDGQTGKSSTDLEP